MKPARSSAYLKWIRTLGCAICPARKGIEAAHGKDAGMSVKGSDFDAIPLCKACHRTGRRAYHGPWKSEQEWAEWWDLDLEALRAGYRERWERSRG